MITCKLMGGLGNQLFQIAAAYSLSIDNNDEFALDIQNCHTPNQGFVASKYENTIYKNILKKSPINSDNFYYEKKFSFSKIEFMKNLCIEGYFQSEKYFVNNLELIKKLFNVKKHDLSLYKKNKTLTSIHIRRGDYLKFSDYHPTCSVEYYKKAMSFIPDSSFLVFSDDINWSKENISGDNVFFMDLKDDLTCFEMMSSCDNNIISNSSFSWWSAYLNNTLNKIIISPKKWFGDLGPKDTEDLIPHNWIKI